MKKFLFIVKGFCIFIALILSIGYVGSIMATVEKTVNIEKAEDCDVVFVGSSHIYRGVNPQLLFDKSGITSVNVATSSQDIKGSYWLLKSYLRHHKPQVAVVEIPTWSALERETYALWNLKEYDYLKYFAYFDLKNDLFDFNEASRFLSFRTKYGNIDKLDFEYIRGEGSLKSDRWYNAVYSETNEIGQEYITERFDGPGDIDDEFFFANVDKIIKLARKKGIAIVFINTPAPVAKHQDEFYTRLGEHLSEENIRLLNYADLHTGSSDFNLKTDFSDAEHLSYEGGTKLTLKICDYLQNEMEIRHEDWRGVDASWIENRLHYQYTYALKNYEKTTLEEYMLFVDTLPDDYIQLMAFDKDAYNRLPYETQVLLRQKGIDVDEEGDSHFVILKRGDEIVTAQDASKAELYYNCEGTAIYLRSSDGSGLIRIGKNAKNMDKNGFFTEIYVVSTDNVILSENWE